MNKSELLALNAGDKIQLANGHIAEVKNVNPSQGMITLHYAVPYDGEVVSDPIGGVLSVSPRGELAMAQIDPGAPPPPAPPVVHETSSANYETTVICKWADLTNAIKVN